MADDDSPRPFRRERNLSSRNFNKRNSKRHVIQEKHHLSTSVSGADDSNAPNSLQSPYSKDSVSEKSVHNMHLSPPLAIDKGNIEKGKTSETKPGTLGNDPALLDVKQKVMRFENLQSEDVILLKKEKFQPRSLEQMQYKILGNSEAAQAFPMQEQFGPLQVQPVVVSKIRPSTTAESSSSTPTTEKSSRNFTQPGISMPHQLEDEVDDISDYEEYVLPDEGQQIREQILVSAEPDLSGNTIADSISLSVAELYVDDFGKVEYMHRSVSVNGNHSSHANGQAMPSQTESKERKPVTDFPRNYRSTPRPKTEILGVKNPEVVKKHHSLYHEKKDTEDTDNETAEEEQIELRHKCDKFIQPILEELIKTEETYVENLLIGIQNYGDIFQRKDLPIGLRGKKYVLLGNIEQIAEFHRDEFLPMLQRNRRDLKRLFIDFQKFIDEDCFYGYVIFTMNKQRSLKLCDIYKSYFKHIQAELDDKLGINSFLVQPIQRMARYPLLLHQFITTLFKNRDYVMKPVIEACCRLEKKVRTLLNTTNESEEINDIVECHEFNVFYQGKFRKVSEFHVFDHTLKRNYRSKVFIFDKCIIYTEMKGKNLVFHGRYPCEHIGITAKTKSFSLFYERRNQQECEFKGEPSLIETWLELIRDMINSYIAQEKIKLQERYSRENDHLHRKTPSLSLYRDSNRFSADSGIGNIWVMPKPENVEELANKRTTWYAEK